MFADEWWQEKRAASRRKPGHPPLLSPSEVLTLPILSRWPRFRSERDFFRFADAHLRPSCPNLLSLGQLNRRIRALEPELRAPQRDLAATLADGSDVSRVLDTTLIPAAALAGPYLTPTTIESGPTRGSTYVSRKPASRSQRWQSVPV